MTGTWYTRDDINPARPMYQNPKNCGGIVSIGSCKILA